MHITARCKCGAVFELAPQFAGMTVECAQCRERFIVPQMATQPLAGPQLVAPPPPQAIPAHTPRPPKPSSSAALLGLLLVVIVLVGLAIPIAGVAYLYMSAKRAVGEVTQEIREVAKPDGEAKREIREVTRPAREDKREVGEAAKPASEAAQPFGGMTQLVQNLPELGKLDETIAELKAQGYVQVSGQSLHVREPVFNKTLFTCQVLEIDSDVHADIVIMAQSATINGTVQGDIEFYGQAFRVEKTGVVKGNVHTKVAQGVIIVGTIEGELSGAYQALQNRGKIVGGVRKQETTRAVGSIVRSAVDSARGGAGGDVGMRRERSPSSSRGTARSLDELLSIVGSGNPIAGRDAAQTLSGLAPEDKDRSRVVAALLPLLENSIARDPATAALQTWISREELPLLQEALREKPDHDERRLRAILALMAQLEEYQEVVTYLNHRGSSVRSDVEKHIGQGRVAPALIAGQCIKDLSHRDRQTVGHALSNLKKLSLQDKTLQRQVVKAVIPLLTNIFHDDEARELVSQYGVAEDDLDPLLKLYRENRNARDIGRLLASSKHPKALEFLASQLGANSDIERIFTELGPEGERYMWPMLRDSNSRVRGQACSVLEDIGTSKSLPRLVPLLKDSRSARDAQRAMEAIRARAKRR